MLKILILLFPALELYLLVKVGSITGALAMVAWTFASAIIGLWAVRAQGQGAMERSRMAIEQGQNPQEGIMDSMLLFFAGVLLILPGLISDAVGLFLLVPVFRRLLMHSLGRYLTERVRQGGASARVVFHHSSGPGWSEPGTRSQDDGQGAVIDSTATVISDSDSPRSGNGRSEQGGTDDPR